jgi:hypothetical protein
MPAPFTRGPLLGRSHEFDDGFRVRLRMARSSDLMPIRDLVERTRGDREVELAALVQFDPRRRWVICATALIDSAETLVGVGSIDLDGDGRSEPDTLLVAGERADEVRELLTGELQAWAAHSARADAA